MSLTIERPEATDETPSTPFRRRLCRSLSFKNISAVYVGIGLVILWSLLIPDQFLNADILRQILAQESITALLAVAVVVPLAAGAFDLSVGMILGSSAITAASLLAVHGVPLVPAALLAVLVGVAIGTLNGLLVVRGGISSFIATLGMTSVLTAYVAWVSDNLQIIGIPPSFQEWATNQTLGISWSFYLLLIVAIAIWYFLEHRPVGRHLLAVGANPEAARLSGIRVRLLVFGALVCSGLVAGIAGVMQTATIGLGSPDIGPAYLLPAYSAAFLGSTQFKQGRFNVWGTVIAVYVLAIGVKGLQLLGAPFWITDAFNGVVLLVAVALAVERNRSRRLPRLFGRRRDGAKTAGTRQRPSDARAR